MRKFLLLLILGTVCLMGYSQSRYECSEVLFTVVRILAIPDTQSCFNRTLSPALTGHRVLLKADTLS